MMYIMISPIDYSSFNYPYAITYLLLYYQPLDPSILILAFHSLCLRLYLLSLPHLGGDQRETPAHTQIPPLFSPKGLSFLLNITTLDRSKNSSTGRTLRHCHTQPLLSPLFSLHLYNHPSQEMLLGHNTTSLIKFRLGFITTTSRTFTTLELKLVRKEEGRNGSQRHLHGAFLSIFSSYL